MRVQDDYRDIMAKMRRLLAKIDPYASVSNITIDYASWSGAIVHGVSHWLRYDTTRTGTFSVDREVLERIAEKNIPILVTSLHPGKRLWALDSRKCLEAAGVTCTGKLWVRYDNGKVGRSL